MSLIVGNRSCRWWDPNSVPDALVGQAMCEQVRALEQRQKARHRRDRLHATLYSDMPVRGLGPFAYTMIDEEPECARLNLVKAVVDTWVAAMVKSTPRPQTLTERGNWDLRRKGEGLNMWIDGTYDRLDIPNGLSPFILRGAGVFGTSFVKVFEDVPGGDNWDEADIGLDVVFQHQITVDQAASQCPRNLRELYMRQWYDVDVLCDMFPGSKSQIRDAAKNIETIGGDGYSHDAGSNLVEVCEGYHLRSSKSAKDGVRAIGLPNGTLLRVPYELDRFPVARFRRTDAPFGLFGIGIPQELRGSQTTINEIMLAYEEAMIFFARPKWMVPRGSAIDRAHLDDRVGSVVEFDGPVSPTMYVPGVVMPTDVMQILQMVWSRGFEQTGTNEILAGGQVPAGLKSGEAIERYNDTGAARGLEQVKAYEQGHVDLTQLMIESGRVIAKKNKKFASTYSGKKRTQMVYFNKIDPGRELRLRVHPTSSLSSSVSGKLEDLDMLLERGIIDQSTYKKVVGWADIEDLESLFGAPFEIIDKVLADMYEADDPLSVALDARNVPDPNWPLEYMKVQAILAAARAFVDNAPTELLDAINTYVDLIDAHIPKPPPAPAMPPGAAPPQMPPGHAPPQLPPAPPAPALAAA